LLPLRRSGVNPILHALQKFQESYCYPRRLMKHWSFSPELWRRRCRIYVYWPAVFMSAVHRRRRHPQALFQQSSYGRITV